MNKKLVKNKLMDERQIVFVRFPDDMLVSDIVAKLNWAKSWKVEAFYNKVIIRCYIKPWYLKHFIKENKSRMLRFDYDKKFEAFTVEEDKHNGVIFLK